MPSETDPLPYFVRLLKPLRKGAEHGSDDSRIDTIGSQFCATLCNTGQEQTRLISGAFFLVARQNRSSSGSSVRQTQADELLACFCLLIETLLFFLTKALVEAVGLSNKLKIIPKSNKAL